MNALPMKNNKEDLLDHYENVTSQRGEDGILKKIFKRLNIEKGNFCEFGAHNGVEFCNTRVLAQKGWSGCYIESNAGRISELQENTKELDVVCIRAMVKEKGDDSFDSLMQKHFNKPLDLVVIDTDGGDYEIMRGINSFRPTVLMIESNPYRPPLDTHYYGYNIGDLQESLYVMNQLAENMGYKMLVWTQNIIFIKERHYHLFDVTQDLMEMFVAGFKRCFIQTHPRENILRMFTRMESERYGYLETQWLREIYENNE